MYPKTNMAPFVVHVNKKSRLFGEFSGRYKVSIDDLVSILDRVTDESKKDCNFYLRKNVSDEASRIHGSHGGDDDKNWRKAKENLAEKMYFCFSNSTKIDKSSELDFFFRMRRAIELGTGFSLKIQVGNSQTVEQALKYIIQNLPKSE